MLDQTENISGRYSPEFLQDLYLRVDHEFAEFAAMTYDTVRRDFEQLASIGEATAQEGDEAVAGRKELYDGFDFNSRVSALTNNFYLWWPGGTYREMLESKKNITSDTEEIAFEEQLVRDLDNFISEGGYGNITDLVQKKNTEGSEREERTIAIADVFLRMLSKGYDGSRLRR